MVIQNEMGQTMYDKRQAGMTTGGKIVTRCAVTAGNGDV